MIRVKFEYLHDGIEERRRIEAWLVMHSYKKKPDPRDRILDVHAVLTKTIYGESADEINHCTRVHVRSIAFESDIMEGSLELTRRALELFNTQEETEKAEPMEKGLPETG